MTGAPVQATYEVVIENACRKYIKKLDLPERRALVKLIRTLAANPYPPKCETLETGKGAPTLYRIRSGRHRIIYTIRDEQLLVLVVRIGDRKEVYRQIAQLAKRYRT